MYKRTRRLTRTDCSQRPSTSRRIWVLKHVVLNRYSNVIWGQMSTKVLYIVCITNTSAGHSLMLIEKLGIDIILRTHSNIRCPRKCRNKRTRIKYFKVSLSFLSFFNLAFWESAHGRILAELHLNSVETFLLLRSGRETRKWETFVVAEGLPSSRLLEEWYFYTPTLV